MYEWRLTALLNKSFNFAIDYKGNPMSFLAEINETEYVFDYIVGFANAESWIGIDANNGRTRVNLSMYNNNRQPLEWMRTVLGGGIAPKKDGYNLQLYGKEAVKALRKIPVTHEDKAAAKTLILYYADNGGIGVEALTEYRELRRRIGEEVKLCTREARREWIKKHGTAHKLDPDQSIPPELNVSPSFSY